MKKFAMWTLIIGAATGFGYIAYDYYKAGFHTLPTLPPKSFALSYKNGLRAIVTSVPDERKTRRYFGFPLKVPFYIQYAWSFCHPPNNKEKKEIRQVLRERNWPGERLEVVCKIKVEGEEVNRGYITSVPKVQ